VENLEIFVDKKSLLIEVLNTQIPFIDNIVGQNLSPEVKTKEDGSPVTQLDLLLSEHIESIVKHYMPGTTFYSEEKFSNWKFPLLALDPLDGTREYVSGINEWAISIGYFKSEHFEGEGWVYNPKTKECFNGPKFNSSLKDSIQYRGEVSRSEWRSGYFTNKESPRFTLTPVGSIAYKLGRLSAGKSDFVISLRPKNIWDIAGGTLLSNKAGIKFYSCGKEVKLVQKLYEPPLIWCREELFSELSKIYS
jgi:fructose-1,6-bisphosphatase/inositol monophosphatase family enzyme